MLNLPDDKTWAQLPPSFVCPHCKAPPLYVEFDEWEVETGIPTETGTHVSCPNEEEDTWHWDMPYVSLMPLEHRAWLWAKDNVRIVESEAKARERLRQWNAGEAKHG